MAEDLRELEKTIRAFVGLVLGDMKGNACVGLMDRAGSRGILNRFSDFKYPQQLDEIVKFVLDHRNEDAYLSPLVYGNERNEKGRLRRTPENALTSNTVYQDSDTCPVDAFRLPPSIHVTTSSGRYQDYWVLAESISAEEAANISHRVAIAHRDQGSDPSSWSANKLLRFPGTTNTRHGFPEEVTAKFTGEIYLADDIAGAYDDVDFEARPLLRLPADVSYESELDLPDYTAALDKLPATFDVGFITREIPDGADRSVWRYRLLCDLFRAGVEFDYVLSLAWHSPASRKWKEDPRNIRGLIAEALKAQQEVSAEPEVHIEPEMFEDNTTVPDITLITEEERDSIAGDSNWIERWTQWNAHKLGAAFNRPYVRLNGWSVLSAAFSDCVFIPRDNGPEYCNLFTIGVGDSGTGKSMSLKLWRQALAEIFEADKGWDIGANFSPNALHEALLQRDKKVSIVNADEAHGWFRQIVGQPWAEGILEVIARYFDGFVPPMLRTTGSRDLNGKTAETYFMMHMFGTRRGELSLTHVLDKSMILSGFLPRCIWAIGEDRRLTENSFAETQANGEYVNSGFEPQLRQWAAEFANTKKVMRTRNKRQYIPMMMDTDALARLGRARWQIVQELRDHPQWELLDPSVIRIGNNIRRAATLLAAEEGASTVTLRHTLIAIREGEKWLKDMVTMTLSVSASIFQREVDSIYEFILNKGGNVRREVVARKFAATRPRDLEEQLNALVLQGRITNKTISGATWLTSTAALSGIS